MGLRSLRGRYTLIQSPSAETEGFLWDSKLYRPLYQELLERALRAPVIPRKPIFLVSGL